MPLTIIRDDITRVFADAIVNPAHPRPVCGGGTEAAIYKKAGYDLLLDARKKIGPIEKGTVQVTDAFGLNARYIFHTVGPVWTDGLHKETETLQSCYRNCLDKAVELQCESIAFPLLASGSFRFPKDLALLTARQTISSFLDDHDLDVILVVYDKRSFRISQQVEKDIKAYIDDRYTEEHPSYGNRRESTVLYAPEMPAAAPAIKKKKKEKNAAPEAAPVQHTHGYSVSDHKAPEEEEPSFEAHYSLPYMPMQGYSVSSPAEYTEEEEAADLSVLADLDFNEGLPLKDRISAKAETFSDMLLRMIDEKEMKDSEVYKKANIDRKLFSKIRSNPSYHPKKYTVIAFALALELDFHDTKELMRSAGYAFSPSSKTDIIIQYCMEKGIYNVHAVNEILFSFDQPLLGV